MSTLSPDERSRYSRHILLSDVGEEGQLKIREAKVLIIGAGGLGAPVSLYLAAAGVGTIGLMDDDVVDLSNLQRQVCHFTPDAGRPKVESAADKLRLINPGVRVVAHRERLTPANALGLVADYDFVIDATDSYASKFLVNDACVLARKPYSHGAVLTMEGDVMTYVPGHACYRCLFGAPPPEGSIPTSSQVGVLGSVAGIVGSIQATEALKFITGAGQLLTDRLLSIDARTMEFRRVNFRQSSHCPLCGNEPSITSLG